MYNNLKNIMEKTFTRVRSIRDIIVSCGLTVAGCILIALPTATSVNVFGFFLIFTGILLFVLLKSAYKEEETGAKYCKTERYFSQSERTAIIEAISSKPDRIDLREEDKGNAIRLDIYHSKQSGKAYLQLFEYVPYKYEPCSRQFEHAVSEISRIK